MFCGFEDFVDVVGVVVNVMIEGGIKLIEEIVFIFVMFSRDGFK